MNRCRFKMSPQARKREPVSSQPEAYSPTMSEHPQQGSSMLPTMLSVGNLVNMPAFLAGSLAAGVARILPFQCLGTSPAPTACAWSGRYFCSAVCTCVPGGLSDAGSQTSSDLAVRSLKYGCPCLCWEKFWAQNFQSLTLRNVLGCPEHCSETPSVLSPLASV